MLNSLTETERFGVEALKLRASPAFTKAKANRPRDGETWDMADCQPVQPTPKAAGPLGAAPGNSFLMGSIALGVVIVNGPTAATQFSTAEQTKIVAEVQAGAGWLAAFNPWAGVSFTYDIRPVTIATQPNAAASDNESRFRNPAVAQLGFQANVNGALDYVNHLRASRNTNWAYCVFFVKGYPLDHFAYTSSIDGARVIMDYANDGWGPDNIDRVFAHESGHVFGCPDEYASSGCSCGGAFGRFGEPNRNCENCAGAAGVGCLMRANEWKMCPSTKRHLGWGLTSLRTRQPGAIGAVSRSTDHLDIFVADGNGAMFTAAWEPAMVDWWEGWWNLLGGRGAPGTPLTVVSRRADYLDVFTVGTDGGAYTCAWTPATGWRGWWRIGTATFPAGSMINAVSRSTDHLDIFATDVAGRVITAAWEPGFTSWHGWWEIRGGRARPGAPVTAVSRSQNKLDVFVVGTDGGAYTAAWEPAFADGWHGWWRIGAPVFPQGAYLGAVTRSADHLDVFGTDTGGRIITAAWEPAFADGWHGWWEIRGGRAQPGAPVTAVSRSQNKLDVFVVGTDNTIYTAAWEPGFADGWHGWWNLNGGKAAHGSVINAVSRRPDFMDVFTVGLDGRVYSAAWSPGQPWGGWWPMGQ